MAPRWTKLWKQAAPRLEPPERGRPAFRVASLAPAAAMAAGAGVAFWWWTQWARGRAESEADAASPPVAAGGVSPVLAGASQDALDESLAVQGDDRAPT